MKILAYQNLLVSVLAAILIVGCSGPLPKSRDLLAVETAYQTARNNPQIIQYAKSDLNEVNNTLQAAAKAETAEDMASLTFIADLKIKTAETVATGKVSEARFKEFAAKKNSLIENVLKSDNQQLQREVSDFQQKESLAKREEEARLKQKLAELKEKEINRNIKFTLGDVLFVTGKADLLPGATTKIDEIAGFLQRYPDKTLLIEGHTDSMGSDDYNMALSQKRADFVKNALQEKGISGNRMVSRGLGQSHPIASNSTVAGRQSNRRIEITVQN